MTRRSMSWMLLALLAVSLSAVIFAVPRPAAAGPAEGLAYILANQTKDGGFREPGRGESGQDATTAWCVMALAASGRDPRAARKGGFSPLDFLASQAGNWRSVTDFERTLLAVAAAGEDPRSFAGIDLVAKVRSFQGAEGNIGDAVNSNAFGMLAYRAAGVGIPEGAVRWHRRAQNADGGWGNSPGSASNPDMTAASIMALRAAGVDIGDPAIASALSYLRSIQNGDGGFSFQPGASDTAATAWCAQAIMAVGQDPAGSAWSRNGNTPLSFVRSMQAPDGRFLWMKGRDMNPVWTTSYAVCALYGKPFPVAVFRPTVPSGNGGETERAGNEGGESGEGAGGEAGKVEETSDPGGGSAEGEDLAARENAGEAGSAVREEGVGHEERSKVPAEEDDGAGRGSAALPLLIAAAAATLLLPSSWWLYRRRPWRRGKSGNV